MIHECTYCPKDLILVGWSGDSGPTLQCGDVVVLNSGGPQMIVANVFGANVGVKWKEGNAIRERFLPAICLYRVELSASIAVRFQEISPFSPISTTRH